MTFEASALPSAVAASRRSRGDRAEVHQPDVACECSEGIPIVH
jgi:hypothetical protein